VNFFTEDTVYILDVELFYQQLALSCSGWCWCCKQIFSPREVADHLTRIRETLSNSTCDWEKRVEAVTNYLLILLFVSCTALWHDMIWYNAKCLASAEKLMDLTSCAAGKHKRKYKDDKNSIDIETSVIFHLLHCLLSTVISALMGIQEGHLAS